MQSEDKVQIPFRVSVKNSSLRARILGLFLLLVLVAVAVVAGATYSIGQNALAETTRNQLSHSVRNVIDQISLLSGAYNAREFSGKLEYLMAGEQAGFREAGMEARIMLIRRDGTLVDTSNINKEDGAKSPLPEALVKEVFRNQKGSAEQTLSGTAYSLSYGYILEKDWSYVVMVTRASYMKVIYRLQMFTLLSGLLAMILALIFSVLGTRGIIRSIRHLGQTVSRADDGNLSVRVGAVHGGSELAALAGSLNTMLANFEATVLATGQAVDDLHQAGSSLSGISGKTSESLDHIHGSAQAMAAGAQQQEQFLAGLRDTASAMIATIQSIVAQVEEAAGTSHAMMDTVGRGLEAVRDLQGRMAEVETVSQTTLTHIRGLEQRSERISRITGTIKGISAQTKLLSFNAAIEAAKAGDAGAGFSVVAGEIQKLAAVSAQSALEVEQIIQDIRQDTRAVLSSANRGLTIAHDSTRLAGETGQAFEDIHSKVAMTHAHIQMISGNATSISGHIHAFEDETVRMMDMVTATGKSCADVAGTVAEHRRLAGGIPEAVSGLQAIAGQLRQLTDTYQGGSAEEPAPRPAQPEQEDNRVIQLEDYRHDYVLNTEKADA